MSHPDHQQPISWGEIADIQGKIDEELAKDGALSPRQLMGLVDIGFLLPDATPTERDIALGYLDAIRAEEE